MSLFYFSMQSYHFFARDTLAAVWYLAYHGFGMPFLFYFWRENNMADYNHPLKHFAVFKKLYTFANANTLYKQHT